MKYITIIASLAISTVLFSQEPARKGSYSIEIKSLNQASNNELEEDILIKIESIRQDSSDTTVTIKNMSVLVMSRENLEKGLVWPKYKSKTRK